MHTLATPLPSPSHRRPPLLFLLWVGLALLVAASGLIVPERVKLVPVLFLGTLLGLVVAYWRAPSMRRFADGVDVRVPILFHVVRIGFGVGFLVLGARGELDATFAERAGWGDVVAGGLAIPAALVARGSAAWASRAVLAFNVIGLADILMVFFTAQWVILFSGHPETMFAIARFPFSTIPPLVLPLIFATHFLIFRRVSRAAVL
jgi:hypothetical protein